MYVESNLIERIDLSSISRVSTNWSCSVCHVGMRKRGLTETPTYLMICVWVNGTHCSLLCMLMSTTKGQLPLGVKNGSLDSDKTDLASEIYTTSASYQRAMVSDLCLLM